MLGLGTSGLRKGDPGTETVNGGFSLVTMETAPNRLLLPKRVQVPDGSMGTGLLTKDWGMPLGSPAQTSY